MRGFAFLLICVLPTGSLVAQTPDFAGRFSMDGQNGPVVVTLRAAGNGQYTGTMSNGSLTWQIKGEVEEGALTGLVDTGQGAFAFEAHVAAARLQLILVEIGPDGVPLVDQGQELLFDRVRDNAAPQAPASKPFPGTGGGTAADPFNGVFSNGQLTLTLQGQGGNYGGRMSLGAEAFPVSARRNGDRVEGTMNAPTGQYGFFVVASVDGVTLSNAGNEYALRRVSAGGQAVTGFPSPAAGTTQPGQQARSDDSPLAQQWRAHLAGRKVTYIDSYSSNTAGGGGFNTKFVYHLCSDGRFAYSGSDVVSLNSGNTDVQGGGSAGSSQGTWRIVTQGQQAGIELRFANGQVELYRLDMQNGQTVANGNRVYVTPGEVCR